MKKLFKSFTELLDIIFPVMHILIGLICIVLSILFITNGDFILFILLGSLGYVNLWIGATRIEIN